MPRGVELNDTNFSLTFAFFPDIFFSFFLLHSESFWRLRVYTVIGHLSQRKKVLEGKHRVFRGERKRIKRSWRANIECFEVKENE